MAGVEPKIKGTGNTLISSGSFLVSSCVQGLCVKDQMFINETL